MQKRVLIVDDDDELVELLCFNLKQAGFVTSTAPDGVEAIEKASATLPDLILLDLMLPELNGFSVCEILRRNATTASIPIIMLTALPGELGRLAGLDSGANHYLSKPCSIRQLVSLVDNLLGLV